jgi:hypothetical protein
MPDRPERNRSFVEYDYSFQGKSYRGLLLSVDERSSERIQVARRILSHPVGFRTECLVNPAKPEESFLDFDADWTALAFLPISFVFMVLGVFGICCLWMPGSRCRTVKDADQVDHECTDGTDVCRHAVHSMRYPVFLFSLCLFAGVAAFVGYGLLPFHRLFAVREWKPTPCRILVSELVKARPSEGGGWRASILYSYKWDGTEHHSVQYGVWDSGSIFYGWKKRAVESCRPGQVMTCYVNPKRPDESVISREFIGEMLAGLVPLLFVLIGGVGLLFVRARFLLSRKRAETVFGESARTSPNFEQNSDSKPESPNATD